MMYATEEHLSNLKETRKLTRLESQRKIIDKCISEDEKEISVYADLLLSQAN